jgi:hypothetical protein
VAASERNLPLEQESQVADPVLTEYLPDPHVVHVSMLVAAAIPEYFPASQAVHPLLPVVLNVPAAQATQEE